MTEIRKLHECSIPVGSAGSRKRFKEFCGRIGAVNLQPKEVACRFCRSIWGFQATDIRDLDYVTCDFCQGEDLVCTQVEAVFYAAGAAV